MTSCCTSATPMNSSPARVSWASAPPAAAMSMNERRIWWVEQLERDAAEQQGAEQRHLRALGGAGRPAAGCDVGRAIRSLVFLVALARHILVARHRFACKPLTLPRSPAGSGVLVLRCAAAKPPCQQYIISSPLSGEGVGWGALVKRAPAQVGAGAQHTSGKPINCCTARMSTPSYRRVAPVRLCASTPSPTRVQPRSRSRSNAPSSSARPTRACARPGARPACQPSRAARRPRARGSTSRSR